MAKVADTIAGYGFCTDGALPDLSDLDAQLARIEATGASHCELSLYELDLIVRRGRKLVFCEVKGKAGRDFGDPLEMVDAEKLRRLNRAAEAWLARNAACRELDCRFEVVAVRGRALERVAV